MNRAPTGRRRSPTGLGLRALWPLPWKHGPGRPGCDKSLLPLRGNGRERPSRLGCAEWFQTRL